MKVYVVLFGYWYEECNAETIKVFTNHNKAKEYASTYEQFGYDYSEVEIRNVIQ